ncbi:MAG TPA: signal peptidase I [Thermoanaerobaculia bacterium]|nr:signal peptidase I [Thermoanaerobaculia bacterium]
MEQKSLLRLLVEPIAFAVALALLARAFFQIYAIPSSSMEPALQVGDRILVTPYRPPFFDAEPARGDVVVFRSPLDPGELLVKRIAGLPGDLVESQIVPAGHYFVFGDNRRDSVDSRRWGPLPRHLIVGRARLVLWSSGEARLTSSARAASNSPSRATRSGALRLLQPVR